VLNFFGVAVIIAEKPVPLFEYECRKCGQRTERIEKSSSGPQLQKCPKCGGKVDRLISAPAIQFKGSGWYVTDYGKSSSSAKKEGGAADGAKSETKSEGKSEDKAASKAPAETSEKKKPAAKSK
jgi:putative FmdB family regulatory protein